MKVIVTGAGGFLGGHLIDWLAHNRPGVEVRSLVRPGATTTLGRGGIIGEIGPADVLVHLAGTTGIPASLANPTQAFSCDLCHTIDIVEEAARAGIDTVLLASSCAVYGPDAMAAAETREPQPMSPYAVAKLAGEQYAGYACRARGQDIRIARIANPYGPGQRKLVVFDLIERALSGERPLRVHSSGEEMRDFIHAADAAAALWTLVEAGAPGDICNVGSGEPLRIRALAGMIVRLCGLESQDIEFETPASGAAPPHSYPDVTKLYGRGFRPSVPIESGLSGTVDWVRNTR